MTKLISVCLCTYKRDHLEDTLRSILDQELQDDIRLEICVVDNDANGYGKKIVEAISKQTATPINYSIQPEKNIALTRNATIEKSNGELIAFIDDDESADSMWLSTLLNCMEHFKADAVIGNVITKYPEEAPHWIKSADLLGKEIPITGTSMNVGVTSNALVLKSAIDELAYPFNIDYGLTGGEDSDFFHRLFGNGNKIVSCQEAVVLETVEGSRLNSNYLLKRALGAGETYARNFISNKSFFVQLFSYLKAIIRAITDGVTYLVLAPLGKRYSFRYRMGMMLHLGKIRFLTYNNQTKLYQ